MKKVEYKSSKWDKEMKRLNDARKACRNDYYINTRYVYDKFKKAEYKDYIWLYGCFVTGFQIIARYHLVDKSYQQVINSTFLSARSWLLFKDFVEKGINTSATFVTDELAGYEHTVCKLIAIDQLKNFDKETENSITANLFNKNEAKAKLMIDEIPDGGEKKESVYYTNPIFLKEAYKAILNKDTEKFNDALIKRIKRYRKNMVGYSTIIDYVSIALIKIAQSCGMEKVIDIVEMPECFWEPIQIDENIKSCIEVSNLLE